MGKITNIEDLKRDRIKKTIEEKKVSQNFSFMEEVEKDITKLQQALGLDRESAIQLAKDFYKRYPMLIEYVRTFNVLLEKDTKK